ncbi:MAG: hypothetical protein AAF208_14105, partial [Cyanobacteria bacterium P01_A01_bin.45]
GVRMMGKPEFKTDLPVLLPATRPQAAPPFQIRLWHGLALFALVPFSSGMVYADDAAGRQRSPRLVQYGVTTLSK